MGASVEELGPDELAQWTDPWEHIRLLSDEQRNGALVGFLRRHAAGKRLLEIGCGTGVWSCLAAKLGATQVYAVEQSATVDVAREMVVRNGLQDRVEVIESDIHAVEPRPVDIAFMELQNADPFVEGVVGAARVARDWLEGGQGLIAPRRMRVIAAAAEVAEGVEETLRAQADLRRLAESAGLDLVALDPLWRPHWPYRFVGNKTKVVGPPVGIFDLDLTKHVEVPEEIVVSIPTEEPISAVVVWFEAELDDEARFSNPPDRPGHWGLLQCGFAHMVEPQDGRVEVVVSVEDDEFALRLA